MKNIGIWYFSKILEIWAKNVKGGLSRLEFLGMTNGIISRKNIKITFLTDTPFIVKFRFEKYRYLLTYLLCIQIFEALLSDSHSTGPQKEDTTITKRRTTSAFACLVWWYCHFVPKFMMKVKLIKYWMPKTGKMGTEGNM